MPSPATSAAPSLGKNTSQRAPEVGVDSGEPPALLITPDADSSSASPPPLAVIGAATRSRPSVAMDTLPVALMPLNDV